MAIDKHTEFELSKLQKKIDKKKTGSTTTIINNPQPPASSQTVMGKPIASDIVPSDGQVLIYNKDKEQWEPGNVSGDADLTNYYTKAETDALIPTAPDQLSDLTEDATHRTVTDTEKTTWNNKLSSETSHADVLVDADIGVTILPISSFSGLSKITVGTTEPATPSTGDLWVDTN